MKVHTVSAFIARRVVYSS